MPPVTNGRVLSNAVPTGYPIPGETTIYDTSETIDPATVPLNGGFLLKTLAISIDPYMRGLMGGAHPGAWKIGQLTGGFAVCLVVRSENPELKADDQVVGPIEHKHYAIRNDPQSFQVLENPCGLPWTTFLGVLGYPGKSAYAPWKECAHAMKGETVFVSAGASAVGSLVIQLAKADGLKVIASAGSDEKVAFMKELGADVTFNYKTMKTAEVLAKEGPIDIYWDNVGGETLEAALDNANNGARFIECGMISGYNTGGAPIRNIMNVIAKSITMTGFLIFSLDAKYSAQFYADITPKVASDEIKHREHIYEGLEKVGEAILAVQKGENMGKAVVHVADE